MSMSDIKDEDYVFEYINEKFDESIHESLRTLCDMWSNVSLRLMEGDLIFSYKNTSSYGNKEGNALLGLAIYRNNKDSGPAENIGNYSVVLVTTSWSVTYPNVPLTYLQVELVAMLKDFCIDEEVLTTYKQIIDNDDLK